MSKTIIAPSILAADFLNLEKDLKIFDGIENFWFHLDIMDGHFVPNLTFGTPIIEKIQKITDHILDAHFMVKNPELYIGLFKNCKIHNFTYHWELNIDHEKMIDKIKNIYPSVGLSINPESQIENIPHKILKKLDLVLIMTVRPGFGGQSFMEDCAKKVKTLKELKKDNDFSYQIQVDGGINNSNAKKLIDYGADNLVAGSFIFKKDQSEYEATVESLRNF